MLARTIYTAYLPLPSSSVRFSFPPKHQFPRLYMQNRSTSARSASERLAQTTTHLEASQRANMTTSSAPSKKHKVCVVGSGNWGSTIAKIVAENAKENPKLFEENVQMWVYEEEIADPTTSKPEKLTTYINTKHENIKYLPGINLPKNLIANPSLPDAVHDASILIFNLPHQFIDRISAQMRGHILPYARGISCIKGVHVSDDAISLFSEAIGEKLGIYVGALSGANIASEVALEKWCETTIAYDPPALDITPDVSPTASEDDVSQMQFKNSQGNASRIVLSAMPAEYPPLTQLVLKTLFHRPYFHVRLVSDVASVSLGGALKNVVALAAGFVDGRGWGDNAKAAIMRVGLLEMIEFGQEFFGKSVRKETFTDESAGMADLITSCAGGRNHRCAKMSVAEGKPIEEIEKRELNGQVLQGTSTAKEVHSFLKARGKVESYPLFTAVYNVLVGKNTVDDIPDLLAKVDEQKGL